MALSAAVPLGARRECGDGQRSLGDGRFGSEMMFAQRTMFVAAMSLRRIIAISDVGDDVVKAIEGEVGSEQRFGLGDLCTEIPT